MRGPIKWYPVLFSVAILTPVFLVSLLSARPGPSPENIRQIYSVVVDSLVRAGPTGFIFDCVETGNPCSSDTTEAPQKAVAKALELPFSVPAHSCRLSGGTKQGCGAVPPGEIFVLVRLYGVVFDDTANTAMILVESTGSTGSKGSALFVLGCQYYLKFNPKVRKYEFVRQVPLFEV